MASSVRIGVVTISDRASQGVYEDKGGPAIRECLGEILSCPWEAVARLIPDEQAVIEANLRDLADVEKCCLIVTTGGTGPAKRDVTPEATVAVCEKMLDGFGEQMRAVSLKIVPTAILSRQVAGVRGQSLIVWAIAEGRAAAAAVDAHLMGSTTLPAPIPPTARPLVV